jgi:hypothetical protein
MQCDGPLGEVDSLTFGGGDRRMGDLARPHNGEIAATLHVARLTE